MSSSLSFLSLLHCLLTLQLTYLHTALAHTRGDKDVAIVKHLIQGLGGGEGGDGDGVEDETVF